MSDEQQIEQRIEETLGGIEPGSAEEKMLSEQLARELGFEDFGKEPVNPAVRELLDSQEKISNPSAETQVQEPEPEPEKRWTYTRDDGTVKEFDDRESYLEYKIGADANKKADEIRQLREMVESLKKGEQPQQQQTNQRPEELLFDKEVLENDEWKPVINVMTKAFEKFYGLQSQELQQKFEALDNQFGELKMSATESAVRSEFGIDRATEQEILEKQPQVVRDSLTKLDPTARLAVIRQLKGKAEAPVQGTPPLPRAVPPQQAHVESSARGEPDRDPLEAFEKKFYEASESDQQVMLGQLFKSVDSALD